MIIFIKAFLRNMEEEPAVHLNYTSFLKLKLKKSTYMCFYVHVFLYVLSCLG